MMDRQRREEMEQARKPIRTLPPPRFSGNGDEPSKGAFRVTGDLKSLAFEIGFGDPSSEGQREGGCVWVSPSWAGGCFLSSWCRSARA